MDRHISAFMQSFNALYANQYGSTYKLADTHSVTDYGAGSPTGLRMEVVAAAWPVPLPTERPLILNLFHEGEEPTIDGLECLYTVPLMGRTLTGTLPAPAHPTYEATTDAHIAAINAMAGDDAPTLAAALLGEPTIRAFFTSEGDEVTAFGMMVTAVAGVLYIGNMNTEPSSRRRGLAGALLAHMHRESGCEEAILVPSWVARDYYQKHGYAPLHTFSVYEAG